MCAIQEGSNERKSQADHPLCGLIIATALVTSQHNVGGPRPTNILRTVTTDHPKRAEVGHRGPVVTSIQVDQLVKAHNPAAVQVQSYQSINTSQSPTNKLHTPQITSLEKINTLQTPTSGKSFHSIQVPLP